MKKLFSEQLSLLTRLKNNVPTSNPEITFDHNDLITLIVFWSWFKGYFDHNHLVIRMIPPSSLVSEGVLFSVKITIIYQY
jgi:hypothetical protein